MDREARLDGGGRYKYLYARDANRLSDKVLSRQGWNLLREPRMTKDQRNFVVKLILDNIQVSNYDIFVSAITRLDYAIIDLSDGHTIRLDHNGRVSL